MSATPQVLLGHHLKALRLPTFLREYDKVARQCAAEGLDHVRYLHRLHNEFVGRLEREGRTEIAQACFDFLPHRARLDLMGWPETDIFAHA